ncbi:transmembrane protease serine 9 [Drosophila elegans]|uniref:transmembrane protease serine 9 n=1 Tax=Drosophila elegans TaxID=30023 RepID=UPI001BC84483|nr:transmembrane protease serine 9 [Drosophila elegans]
MFSQKMSANRDLCLVGIALLAIAGFAQAAPPLGRVVNGTDSSVDKYPFVISLRGSKGSHSCGGSIISKQFAMTAAHCTAGRKATDLSVQFGVTKINATGPNVVRVKKIIQHEDYNPYNNYANDISLLLVEEPFELDGVAVAAVKLPDLSYATPQTDAGGEGVLIGWGLNATGGSIQTTLQEVGLKVYSDAECESRHEGRTDRRYHICGGVDEGGKGQCSGDSGGPLIYNGQQVGIVSWSIKPCTAPPYPGVYTKVSQYIDWIKKNQIILAGEHIASKMLSNQDLSLAVVALLAITTIAQAAPTLRVVNGTDSSVEKYPYVVSLRSYDGSHSCGGTIVSQQFVMTAAHCTNGRSAESLSIQYGVTNINATGPNVVGIKRVIQHTDFDPTRQNANDISLLMVEEPFEFDGVSVGPVELPPLAFAVPQSSVGVEGVLLGWGLNETYGSVQDTLQEVSLKIYSDEECTTLHGGKTDPQYHICGGVDEGGKGQCSGDSGGPLIYNGQQVGIVSWSVKPCTVAPYPGVYCKVSQYVDWIKQSQIIFAT